MLQKRTKNIVEWIDVRVDEVLPKLARYVNKMKNQMMQQVFLKNVKTMKR